MRADCSNKRTTLKRGLLLSLFLIVGSGSIHAMTEKPRLLIMADMGNEPDEEQQMTHMLLYSNMFELEGLIACSGLYLHSGVRSEFRSRVHPELFTKLINAYAQVVDNLHQHADGWPSPDYLHSIVRAGSNIFGMDAVKEGQPNEASKLIETAILKQDPRKLYIAANAGTNPLAQALVDLDAKHYWGGQSGRFSRAKHKNIMSRHKKIREDEAAYGDFYMYESDSESETWTDPVEHEDFSGREVPVWRFRRSMFNDFRARMDWCVKAFDEANHHPIAAVNGDATDNIIHLEASPGQTLDLDAGATRDPDGDQVELAWWNYLEAGTYDQPVKPSHATSRKTSLLIPADASGKEIHLILEAQDDNSIVPMYDYRRMVIHVTDAPE